MASIAIPEVKGLTAIKLHNREKSLLKKFGQAVREYGLIGANDRICVAVSGGQDSLTLLKLLSSRTVMESFRYYLMAVHVAPSSELSDADKEHTARLKAMFEELNIPYHIENSDAGKPVDGETVNCFWCSWNRRKAIFLAAEKHNCNKVAFGHHKDDIIETVLLNLFFNGEISTMNPRQEMFGGKMTIIRPLAYLEKKDITAYSKLAGYAPWTCTCRFGDLSKRKMVRDIIEYASKRSSVVKSNIFRAPSRIRKGYLGEAGPGAAPDTLNG